MILDKLKHYWQIISHPRSWWTHTRFWWYTTHRERVIVLSILTVVSITVGSVAYHNINHAANQQEIHCLALNIYHEARGEPRAGQYAVGEVTMNRVKSPKYPANVCDVVHQKHWNPKRKRYSHAFSWTNNDYAVNLRSRQWRKAVHVAREIYHDNFEPQLDGAMYYHSKYVRPGRAKRYDVVARIGQHIFYK